MTAISTPVAVGVVVDSGDGESDLWAKAEEIARREFSTNATIEILNVTTATERFDEFGGRLRPDYGYLYYWAQIRVTNTGKLDVAPADWQFSAMDEMGSDHSALLGGAHHDFDASRLRHGGARVGSVVFEMREGSILTAVAWQGDLTSAIGYVPGWEPDAEEAPPAEEPPTAPDGEPLWTG